MNKQIKMVVFDMAGTTVNEDNIVYKTVKEAINESGFKFTLEQVLAEGAGKEKLQAIKSILETYGNNTDAALADEIYLKFSAKLTDTYAKASLFPQPNSTQVFSALKERGIITILNTGYQRTVAESIIKKLNWNEGTEYDRLVTATDVKGGRPEPDMIHFVAEEFSIDPSEIIKVGDSIIDIEEGKNAGCALSIGITTGAHTTEQLKTANPDYILDNLLELLPIIDKH